MKKLLKKLLLISILSLGFSIFLYSQRVIRSNPDELINIGEMCFIESKNNIDPVTDSYTIEWEIETVTNNVSSELSIKQIGLNGSGSVLSLDLPRTPSIINNDRKYYTIKNNPITLNPNNQPFNTWLIYQFPQDLIRVDTLAQQRVFLRSSPLDTRGGTTPATLFTPFTDCNN